MKITIGHPIKMTGALGWCAILATIALGGCANLPQTLSNALPSSTPQAAVPASCKAPDGSSVPDKIVNGVIAGCNFALAARSNALESLAISAIPYGSQVSAAVDGGCLTAGGICSMVQSPTTQEWLSTVATLFASKGKTVLPPPK